MSVFENIDSAVLQGSISAVVRVEVWGSGCLVSLDHRINNSSRAAEPCP